MGVTNSCSPWADLGDVAQLCPGDDCRDLDPYILEESIDSASFLLNAWSAFQYQGGKEGCEVVVRPVAKYGPARSVPEWGPGRGAGSWNPAMWPVGTGGWGIPTGWLDTNGWGFCGCGGSPLARRTECCGGPSQVALGHYPVNSITEVLVNGNVVPDDEYLIQDQRWLVRTPAPGDTNRPHWPYTQRVDLPATEDHTFQVSANVGGIVPMAGVRAAVDLGCAIAEERCSGDCALPPGVTQVTREGVSVAIVRPTEDVIDALPSSVRLFLNSVNPGGLRRRPRVFSPDLPREVVTTTWQA